MKRLKLCIVLLCLVEMAAMATATPPNSPQVCPNPNSPCCISSEWWSGGWIYLVFVGISVLMLSFSLLYMVSKIIEKPEWVVWIKDEFFQTIVSVAIVLLLVFVLSSICYVFSHLVTINNMPADPFAVAHTYLDDLVWDKTLNLATMAFQSSLLCQIVAAYKTETGGTTLGTTYKQNAGLTLIAVNFDFIYTLFAGLSASLMVQDIGLSIIQAFAFRIMLPLGILFRVFPFLRKAGALLIALSIGLYIVFPLCFVMDKVIVDSVQPDVNAFLAGLNFGTLVGTYVLYFISAFLPWALLGIIYLSQQAAALLPQALFLPTLNLVITLTFVKNASRVLSQNFGELGVGEG